MRTVHCSVPGSCRIDCAKACDDEVGAMIYRTIATVVPGMKVSMDIGDQVDWLSAPSARIFRSLTHSQMRASSPGAKPSEAGRDAPCFVELPTTRGTVR